MMDQRTIEKKIYEQNTQWVKERRKYLNAETFDKLDNSPTYKSGFLLMLGRVLHTRWCVHECDVY